MRTRSMKFVASRWAIAIALGFLAGTTGCSATTGVDVEVEGADKLGADQIAVTGGIGTDLSHMATEPSVARALLSPEDVRVILPDEFSGQVVTIRVQLMKGGQPLGDPQENKAVLVRNVTKRIHYCFNGPCAPVQSTM